MIRLRKAITLYLKTFCWFLLFILLVDFANLLSLKTDLLLFTVDEGEAFSFHVENQDHISSFIDNTPEPNNIENSNKLKSVYDLDSPLLSYYTDSKDNSFCFFQLLFEPSFATIDIFEIIYLKNCIFLI